MRSCLPHLQLAILIVIKKHQPVCGYRILKMLKEAGFDVEEAAVYTILQRLYRRGLLDAIEVAASNRRIKRYVLTEKGRQELQNLLNEYMNLSNALNRLLGMESEKS